VDPIEAAFKSFHSLLRDDYIGISFTVFNQLKLCRGMLLHLSTMDFPGRDKMDARRRVYVLAVADQTVGDSSRASVLYGGHVRNLREMIRRSRRRVYLDSHFC